jgi:hypothetical protein
MAATSATSRLCLGVPIVGTRASGGFDALSASFAKAIQEVQAVIQADRNRATPAFSAPLFPTMGKKARAAKLP